MALSSLKGIGLEIPAYAKPDMNTDLKISQAPSEPNLTLPGKLGKIQSKAEEIFGNAYKNTFGKIMPYLPHELSPAWGQDTIKEKANEDSLINSSFALSLQKNKMGKVLTPEEENIVKQGKDLASKRITDLAAGFLNPEVGFESKFAEELTPVQKVINALKEAKPIRGTQESLYTAERGAKIAKSTAIGAKTSGEAGFYSELGALKGELPKVQFESLRETASQIPKEFQSDFYNKVTKGTGKIANKVSQMDIDNLFNQVKNSPLLNDWDKITARQGLAKLFGEYGGKVPTEGELTLLNRVFPKEFTDTLLSKRPFMDKAKEAVYQLANIPRSLMASFDVSAPLRQGAFILPKQILTQPVRTFQTFVDMFKSLGSEKAYQSLQEGIVSRPTFKLMQEAKLSLTGMDNILSQREERFMSNWAEKVPGVRASGRAYTGFLNKMRADLFDDLIKKANTLGLNPSKNYDLLKQIGSFVNAGTGRGNLGGLQRVSTALNSFFFSPRLMASRLTLLNPLYYVKANPFVRQEALKSLFTFSGTILTVLGLAKLGGIDVGTDSRSSDFLKMKVGNTRIDIGAGFQQYLRIAGQLITGQSVSSTSGKVMTLGEGYKPLTRYDILFRQIEGKEAPLFSFATDLLKGQTFAGQPLNFSLNPLDTNSEISSKYVPMVVQDMIDIIKDNPSLLPLSVLGFLGVGLQTYQGKTNIKGVPSLKDRGIKMPSLKNAGILRSTK